MMDKKEKEKKWVDGEVVAQAEVLRTTTSPSSGSSSMLSAMVNFPCS